AHSGERLPMSLQLLVLLLFLIVENQNLLVSALSQHFASHYTTETPFSALAWDYPSPQRTGTRLRDVAIAARDCEHIIELDFSVGSALCFNSQYVPGCLRLLLAAGANNRVHKNASMSQGRADTQSTLSPRRS